MVSATAVVALTMSACTSTAHSISPTTSKSGSSTASSVATPLPADVTHVVLPPSVQVLAALDNQTNSTIVGSWPTSKKYADVALSCSGKGDIKINIPGIGVYPLPCQQGGPGASNVFQIDAQKTFTVKIESLPGQKWAVTVGLNDKLH